MSEPQKTIPERLADALAEIENLKATNTALLNENSALKSKEQNLEKRASDKAVEIMARVGQAAPANSDLGAGVNPTSASIPQRVKAVQKTMENPEACAESSGRAQTEVLYRQKYGIT